MLFFNCQNNFYIDITISQSKHKIPRGDATGIKLIYYHILCLIYNRKCISLNKN